MKIQAKLGISTGILVSAMLLSAVTAHVRVARSNQISSLITTSQIPMVASMQNLGIQLSLTVRALESSMLFGIEPTTAARFLEERRQSMDRADSAIASFREHLRDTSPGAADLDRFHHIEAGMARLKQLEEQSAELNDLHTAESMSQAGDIMRNDILPLDASLQKQIRDLGITQQGLADAQMASLAAANRAIVLTLWVGTLFSTVLGAWVSLLLTRRITNSIRALADRANSIAAGDLTGKDLSITSRDEIGGLAIAMQKMQANLATVIGTAIQTTRSLTGSADTMHTASDLIHQRIDQQSQQTQQAATALQQMSASIAEVSRHAQSAADTARAAAQTAHEGGDVVKQMLGSMSSIATAVHDTSTTVGLLGEDSKRISQIVTVIDEIARKTNLLALNAAIEAARAGEQGRGFAVVAGEVRRLAESTAQATSQIAIMIRGIQERTHVAIASLATGTVTVEQGVITTNLAGEALGRIIGMAERVDRMIAQIAIAATQQSVAANQSSASLHSIYSLSHENLCEMTTTAAGIETLRATAIALEQHVIHFHLEDPTASSAALTPQPKLRSSNAPVLLPV
jgi:methyl-accepting chemotaxis protein